jgi:hypothetical protein
LNLTDRGITKVKEYFYNKRGLELSYFNFFPAFGTQSTKIDNLKFVETDMIPFFLLGTESRINQKVVIPLGAVSPFIDFKDDDTNFLDSIVITETIFTPLENPQIVVTPGSKPDEIRIPGIRYESELVEPRRADSPTQDLTGGDKLPSSSTAQSNSNPSDKVPSGGGGSPQQNAPSGRN